MRAPSHQRGFTYLGLLFLIAAMGIGLAATGAVWHQVERRAKERELLFVGSQFRRAIGEYYERTPGGTKAYPTTLAQLLEDKRYVTTERRLRRIYRDPMTGTAEWELVKRPDGAIVGVYSTSQDEPVKRAGFGKDDASFANATQYVDWKFIYTPVPLQTPAK